MATTTFTTVKPASLMLAVSKEQGLWLLSRTSKRLLKLPQVQRLLFWKSSIFTIKKTTHQPRISIQTTFLAVITKKWSTSWRMKNLSLKHHLRARDQALVAKVFSKGPKTCKKKTKPISNTNHQARNWPKRKQETSKKQDKLFWSQAKVTEWATSKT